QSAEGMKPRIARRDLGSIHEKSMHNKLGFGKTLDLVLMIVAAFYHSLFDAQRVTLVKSINWFAFSILAIIIHILCLCCCCLLFSSPLVVGVLGLIRHIKVLAKNSSLFTKFS
ncbi:hypothetical protein ACJX0J_033772, partial [Zea mays]